MTWIWEERSISHPAKFVKLREYGQTHAREIKEINDVRVCFSNEFLVGRGSDATRVYVGLSRDGYERAVKRLPRDDCACLAEQEKKILNEPNAFQSNCGKISVFRRQKRQGLGISYHGLMRRNVDSIC